MSTAVTSGGDSAQFEIAAHLRPGDRVLVPQGCGEPAALSRLLVDAHARVGPFETFLGPVFSQSFAGPAATGMRFASYGAMGRAGQLARRGQLAVWPLHYGALNAAFEAGAIAADVVLLHLARGPSGLGVALSHDFALAAAPRARAVIAQVNARAPFCQGGELPKDLRIDAILEVDEEPVPLETAPLGPAEQAIATQVAALIPDRATLQFGIGAIPDAVLTALGGHRDLGIHSGVIGERLMPLIETGAVSNAHKSLDRGLVVTNTIFGTAALNRFVDRNPAIRLRPASYTHAFSTLSAQERLVAVNSALEVDLGGAVNAEAVDGVAIGGTGGLVEFLRGARASRGGLAIVALRATDRSGAVSRIVPRLSTTTVARSDIDVVVTEHGCAHLRHLDLPARARALIAIAAPQHREPLERALAEETAR